MQTTDKHLTNSEALLRAVDCLLSTVTAEKYWGDNFYEDWNPIITALTSELLISCGLTPNTPWYVKRHNYARHTLQDSLKWLDNKIAADGSFGTDFWDGLRLAAFIEREKLHLFFPAYERLKAAHLTSVKTNTLLASKSIWTGPGFLAAAVDYLDLLGMGTDGDALVQRIVGCQQSDGSWHGNVGPDGHPLVSPVWHTAQVVWTLSRRGASEHRERINKAITWLKSTQSEEGYWGGQQQFIIYFTSYALMALLHAEKPEKKAIACAIDFLKSNMTPDGKCSDMGGSLMCALALRQVIGQHFQHNLTVVDYVLSRNNAVRAEAAESVVANREAELDTTRQKLEKVEEDYKRLAERYADGEIVITKRAAFAIGAIGIILALLVPVFAEFAKAWVAPKSASPQITVTNAVGQSVANTTPPVAPNRSAPVIGTTTNANP